MRVIIAFMAFVVCSPVAAAAQGADRFEALLGLARVKRDAGDLPSARTYFELAGRVRSLSDGEQAEYFWVLANASSPDAVPVGTKLLVTSPAVAGHEHIRDRLIVMAAGLGDGATVVALARDGQRRSPFQARWPRHIAEWHQRRGDDAAAADAYAEVVATSDHDVRDVAGLALAAETAGDADRSIRAWGLVGDIERRSRPDWMASYLRTRARISPPNEVASEIETWLAAHPDDRPMRELAVHLWSRAGEPAKAVALMGPLVAGPDADLWTRREAALARAAGDRTTSIAAMERLHRKRRVTAADSKALAELLIEAGQFDRAATVLAVLASGTSCDNELFTLLDRLRDPQATALMAPMAARLLPTCPLAQPWVVRSIQRFESRGLHAEALGLVEHLPDTHRTFELRRLMGQLRLWTGDETGAIQVLEPLLTHAPDDQATRVALMDAYRAVGQAQDAWRVGEPLARVSLDTATSTRLAAAALEAGRPRSTVEILSPLPATDSRAALVGRALLALGRPEPARRMLATVASDALDPDAALSLVDSTAAMRGPSAALAVVPPADLTDPRWRHVASRRAQLQKDNAEIAWWSRPVSSTTDDLVYLAGRDPENVAVRVAAANALLAESRYNEAFVMLVPHVPPDELPVAGRIAAARSLQGLARPREALALVDALDGVPGDASLVRAQLITAVRGWAAAHDAFEQIANSPAASSATFLAWAGAAPDVRLRLQILDRAVLRWPSDANLLTQLSTARLAADLPDDAVAAAEQALTVDSRAVAAWFALIDATGALGSDERLDAALVRFESVWKDTPNVLVGMSERVAGLAGDPDAPALARVLSWLPVPDATRPQWRQEAIARARVLAAREAWADAIRTLEDVIARDPSAVSVLKLRAEMSSWSGQFSAAIAAYDAYLAAAPADLDARRQQARVASWAGWSREATARYRSLVATSAVDAALKAEADAKTAYLTGRWRTAEAAYERWVLLEPANSEARFELAEVRRARGKAIEADAGLRELELQRQGHRLAGLAYRRADARARPSATFFTGVANDRGYSGRRLLDVAETGGMVADTWGSSRNLDVAFYAARVEALTSGTDLLGMRAGVGIAQRLNESVRVAATASRLAFGSDVVTWAGSAAVQWVPADRWTTSLELNQGPILDTIATVAAGMVARGPRGVLQFTTPRASWSVSGAWVRLSDRNVRQQLELSGTRVMFERLPGLRIVGWAQQTWNRRIATDYFAPASFTRVDGGAEYTMMLTRPRFRGDRENSLTAGYLLGTDARGFVYRHPYGRASFELGHSVVMDAKGELITSPDYRHTRWTLAVRVGGAPTRGVPFSQ